MTKVLKAQSNNLWSRKLLSRSQDRSCTSKLMSHYSKANKKENDIILAS